MRNTNMLGKCGIFLFPYNDKMMESKFPEVIHVQREGMLLAQSGLRPMRWVAGSCVGEGSF